MFVCLFAHVRNRTSHIVHSLLLRFSLYNTMSFNSISRNEYNRRCQFLLTSSTGVEWEDARLHRAIVSFHRSSEDWKVARIELQGTLEEQAVPQLFVYTEKDLDWWPLLRRVLTVEGWSLSELLDHRLGEFFRSRRLLEEEVTWAAALEFRRDSGPPPVFSDRVTNGAGETATEPKRYVGGTTSRRRLFCSPGF